MLNGYNFKAMLDCALVATGYLFLTRCSSKRDKSLYPEQMTLPRLKT